MLTVVKLTGKVMVGVAILVTFAHLNQVGVNEVTLVVPVDGLSVFVDFAFEILFHSKVALLQFLPTEQVTRQEGDQPN